MKGFFGLAEERERYAAGRRCLRRRNVRAEAWDGGRRTARVSETETLRP